MSAIQKATKGARVGADVANQQPVLTLHTFDADYDAILERYRELRTPLARLNRRLANSVPLPTMRASAQALGLRTGNGNGGASFADNELEMAALLDYAIFQHRALDGLTVVQRYFRQNPPTVQTNPPIPSRGAQSFFPFAEREQMFRAKGRVRCADRLLDSAGGALSPGSRGGTTPSCGQLESELAPVLLAAHHQSLQVLRAEPGVGVQVEDDMAGGTFFLADVVLSHTVSEGFAFASRIVHVEGHAPAQPFAMRVGPLIPVDLALLEEMQEDLAARMQAGPRPRARHEGDWHEFGELLLKAAVRSGVLRDGEEEGGGEPE